MDRPISFWLRIVDRLIEERFDAALDEHGVTRRQWQLLSVLDRGSANITELDAALDPSPDRGAGAETVAAESADAASESVSSDLAELVESEWVGESPSGFALTPLGKQSFERVAAVVLTIRDSASEGLAPGDYETTNRTLEQMAHNLGWVEA